MFRSDAGKKEQKKMNIAYVEGSAQSDGLKKMEEVCDMLL